MRARVPAIAAASCVVAFGLVLVAAYAVSLGGHADTMALDGFIALRGPFATPIAVAASHLADPAPVAMITLALAAFGWAFGRTRQAVAALALVPLSIVTAEALKLVLAHARDYGLTANAHIGAAAFPSGHATAAMAIALAAVLVVPRRIRPVVAAGAAVYAIAVSTSLLILAWHYPSDVFGGMLVASFYFCAAVAALRLLPARRAQGAEAPALAGMPRGWHGVLAAAAVFAGVVLIARAGDATAYAADHTLATITALAIAGCSAALVAGAGLLSDRA
jgi:membrane-associated phospholipid phosphatase